MRTLSGPRPDRTGTAVAYGLAGLLAGAGVAHFVAPRGFVSTIPPVFPAREQIVLWSGVVELGCAAGLAVPRTRRRAGWVTAVLFVVVFPGNLHPALTGGYRGVPGWLGTPAAAWLRLPLQIPLVLAGLRVARGRWWR